MVVLVWVLQRNTIDRMCVCLYIYRERDREREQERERQRFILRNWLVWLWRLAGLKSTGLASGPGTQGRDDVTVLSKVRLEQNSVLLRGPQSFSLKALS